MEPTPTPTETPPVTQEQIKQVIEELAKNSHVYADTLRVLMDKQYGKLADLAPGLITELGADYNASSGAVGSTISHVKAGVATTEFQMSSWVNKTLAVIGILAPVLEGLMAYIQEHPFREESFLVTALCAILKTLVTVSYARGRTALKK